MQERGSQFKTTTQVVVHVERVRASLKNIHAENVSTDGVFFNHQMTLAALKVARDELNKAIDLMERTRWTR
jgi:hypothetical protein